MKKLLITLLIFLAAQLFASKLVYAQDNNTVSSYGVGTVINIMESPDTGAYAVDLESEGSTIEKVNYIPSERLVDIQKGEKVVFIKITQEGDTGYYVVDRYRLSTLFLIFALFFILVVTLTRLKGFLSFVGLFLSVLVLTNYLAPNLLRGGDAIYISMVGIVLISISSMFFAHGLNIRTILSVFSTVITLLVSLFLSVIFVKASYLSGMGTEESFFLGIREGYSINMQGVLLVGIIVGALGVLDDITTAQTAVVEELKKANSSLNVFDLYKRASSVGTEHIASLVNTLVLAYAGAGLPMFLLFYVANDQPIWVTLNSEYFAEEIVRTLVGSMSLVLAVPIATIVAAWYFSKYQPRE